MKLRKFYNFHRRRSSDRRCQSLDRRETTAKCSASKKKRMCCMISSERDSCQQKMRSSCARRLQFTKGWRGSLPGISVKKLRDDCWSGKEHDRGVDLAIASVWCCVPFAETSVFWWTNYQLDYIWNIPCVCSWILRDIQMYLQFSSFIQTLP